MGIVPDVFQNRLSIFREVAIVPVDINIERVFKIVGAEEVGQRHIVIDIPSQLEAARHMIKLRMITLGIGIGPLAITTGIVHEVAHIIHIC